MKVREQCYIALLEICLNKQYSNLYIANHIDQVANKDQGLYTQIIYGTLQNYRLCRYIWMQYTSKAPIEEVALVLDQSVYQLCLLDKIPDYAIINDAVSIMKAHHNTSAAFVNAILRKVANHKEYNIRGSDIEQLAIKTSHKTWLIQMWIAQYGQEITQKIAEHNILIKDLCVRVNTMMTTRDEIIAQDANFTKGLLSEDALIYHGDNLLHSKILENGLIALQDEASQYVSIILDAQPNELILDVCSAPGSKAMHIGQRMLNKGKIVCLDIHEHRVKLIENSAVKNHISIIEAKQIDARMLLDLKEESFDRVLCDVPCSGYGVLAHKSDIKYHMNSEDMDTLIPLQYEILCSSAKKVKDKGILVYSTCTLNKKENEKQIEKFLANNTDFKCLHQETIFPFIYNSDGFYIAKLVKK